MQSKLLFESEILFEADLEALSRKLLQMLPSPSVLLLEGEVGAGKTTFSKFFLEQAGVNRSEVASPTYALINEYNTNIKERIYHLDLYRLDDPGELWDIGIEDVLQNSFKLMLVEWAELLLPFLDKDFFVLQITKAGGGRKYSLSKVFATFT